MEKEPTEYTRRFIKISERIKQRYSLDINVNATRYFQSIKTKIKGIHYEWCFFEKPNPSLEIGLHLEFTQRGKTDLYLDHIQNKLIGASLPKDLLWERNRKEYFAKNWAMVYYKHEFESFDEATTEWAANKTWELMQLFNGILDELR